MADLYDETERRKLAEIIIGDTEPDHGTRDDLIERLTEALHPDTDTIPIDVLRIFFDDDPPAPPPQPGA